ncbi:MAG: VOC family protein [Crocinitomicaceae bacterium]|nr:VOC family protein [Crocinitomicaceae bacterium]
MKKVTGVGGIFIKCDDPDKMKDWYRDNLGFDTNEYGAMFESRNSENTDLKDYLQWSTFDKKSKYFDPSKAQFMVNYRVHDLVSLEKELRAAGFTICDEIETFEYGKFLHIMDPEGNKIELWEPTENPF